MQSDANKSIKYLMKELDPSEAVSFEKRMLEDEELLMEVECLRKTLRRLDNLPSMDPPPHVREAVVHYACQCARNRRKNQFNFLPFAVQKTQTKYYTATVLILVGIVFGVLSYQYEYQQSAGGDEANPVSTARFSGSNSFSGHIDLNPWKMQNGFTLLESAERVSKEVSDDTVLQQDQKTEDIKLDGNGLKEGDLGVTNNGFRYQLTGQ